MSMPALEIPPRRWTEQEFYTARDRAPAGERWELVEGEVLVTPGPHWSHQRVSLRLFVLLDAYVRAHALGEAFAAPCDVMLESGLVMQPDVFVVPDQHLRSHDDVVSRLLLAVETLSPGSAQFDRVIKRPHYQRNRVPEYWIIDGASRTIERWQPDDDRPAVVSEVLIWHPDGAREPFTLDLPSFFREVLPSPDRPFSC